VRVRRGGFDSCRTRTELRTQSAIAPDGQPNHDLLLVPRFYDAQAGRVLIDGHDVRDLTFETLGRHVGMVFQDTFLFHSSIVDNLRHADPDAADAQLVAACQAAYLHDFIRSLPEGYETVVGERGHRLKDPRILILDEATSNLDCISEQLIQAALRPLFAGRTSLVIAHRLSTILAADRILVFDQGRLVEQGRHADLVERDGVYAALYERQFLTDPSSTTLTPA
jgi:ATP-binding cassette subfamily B protein